MEKTYYFHFRRFSLCNIFKNIYYKIVIKYLSKSINKKFLITDTSGIFNKNGKEHVKRNKYFKEKKITKISMIIDDSWIPLSVLSKAGNINDSRFIFFIKRVLLI